MKNLKKIKGDASSRKFFRKKDKKITSIIVYTQKDKFKNALVSAINNVKTTAGGSYSSIQLMFCKNLNDFIAPSAFKSYEELKTRLDIVLSGKTTVGNVTDSIEEETVAAPKVDTTPSEAPKVAASVDSEDQDSMDYFNKLANA